MPGKMHGADAEAKRTGFGTVLDSSVRWSVKSYGAKGNGSADDTQKILDACTANPGGTLWFPAGTYPISSIVLPFSCQFKLDFGATLLHANGAIADMLIVAAGLRFRMRGGAVNGLRAYQSFDRSIIRATLHAGGEVDVRGVDFTGTRAAALMLYELGGTLRVRDCTGVDMAEHDGIVQHATCFVNVQSGQVGQRGRVVFSHNELVGTDTPALPGGSPGGLFMAPTTDYAGGLGNFSTLLAEGNDFWGIGQNCAGNDIGCIHTYPVVDAARLSNNRAERCGFAAFALKSVTNVVATNIVIVDGQTSDQNDPTAGAFYYSPGDHAAGNARPRAIFTNIIVDTPGGSATQKGNALSIIGTPTSMADQVIVNGLATKGCGRAVWVDYAVDVTIAKVQHAGATGGPAGTENGIEFNHVSGVAKVDGSTLVLPNGYGIVATNGYPTMELEINDTSLKHTTAGSYAVIARGIKRLAGRGVTIESTSGALNAQGDGVNNLQQLDWDPAQNTILAGTQVVEMTTIDRIVGSYTAPDFAPALLPSVTAHFDSGAQVTQAGGLVSSWVDIVGGYTASAATAPKQPLLVANTFKNRPGLRSNGTTTEMLVNATLTNLITAPSSFVYCIVRPITIAKSVAPPYDNDCILLDSNGVFGLTLKSGVGAVAVNHGGWEACSTALTLGRPVLLSFRHSGGNISLRVGNQAWSAPVASADVSAMAGPLRLFLLASEANPSNVDLGALTFLNAQPSYAADRAYQKWAAGEFGVTL